jgi:transcriptional regulator with XRE-family HTH domain
MDEQEGFGRLPEMMTPDAELYRLIGKRLRARRRSLDLTQSEVARACDTTFQQIQKHEAGGHPVSVGRLLRLAEVLQVPIGYFLEASVEEACAPLADQKRAGRASG